jgi:PIN domain nuclease of toxin-antitoxin system
MSLLLDTHTLVWWLNDDPRLPDSVRAAIAQPAIAVLVSAATGWEIATKTRRGRWPEAEALLRDFERLLANARFDVLPIAMRHAILAGTLPGDHKDPFDRILAAQCLLENLTLVTVNPAFRAFGVSVMW